MNPNGRKPLTVRQVVEFLQQQLNQEGEISIFHTGTPSILAPLTEVLISDDKTSPTFISLYARDEMNNNNNI